MIYKNLLLRTGALAAALAAASVARADGKPDWVPCPVNHAQLKSALVAADQSDKTGFGNHFWAVVVNRKGVVCEVAFSGPDAGSQWLASRQIAAAKAFTANGLSLNIPGSGASGTGALSTAQLYRFVQPSNPDVANPLYGLNGGNVLNSLLAYDGDYDLFGTPYDPMIGRRIGGTISFGGGLGLYKGTTVVGGIGLSGDTACRDHSVAWQTRINLKLQQPNPQDQLPFATNAQMTDGHPHCPNDKDTRGAQ